MYDWAKLIGRHDSCCLFCTAHADFVPLITDIAKAKVGRHEVLGVRDLWNGIDPEELAIFLELSLLVFLDLEVKLILYT